MPLRTATRRTVLAGALVSGLAAPRIVAAQSKLRRIGVIHWEGPDAAFRKDEVRKALEGVGYREDVNVSFDWRWASGVAARAAEAATELEASGVDVIFASSTPTVHAAKDVVRRTPIVFTVADALSTGIVANLTRPGGLLTGVMIVGPELAPKRLEILREAMPGVSRVGFLASALDPNAATFVGQTTLAAASLGLTMIPVSVRGPDEFDAALERMAAQQAQAVVLQTLFVATARRFIEPALNRGLAAIGDQPKFAQDGALMAFGPERSHLFERVAAQIDRILKGASPGDIPVEGPTKFVLAVNQKTARVLGLELPASLLIRADEIFE